MNSSVEHRDSSLLIFLDTPELLEQLLLHLPLVDLLSARLTCRDWNHLIAHSCTIQQALFLRPTRITTTQCANAESFEHAKTNTPIPHLTSTLPAYSNHTCRNSILTRDASLNPLFASHIFPNSIPPPARFGTRHGFLQASAAVATASSAAWPRCPPVVRRMYALQPPSPAMSIGTCRGWWGWDFDDLKDPEGVKVGQVLDWLGSNGVKLRKGFIVMSCPPAKKEEQEIATCVG